jgi:hypothetical protein
MASNYIVKTGETITDVCINATGTINNWDKILAANDFEDWIPILTAGQSLIIPDDVEIQTNVLLAMQITPACNNLEITDFDSQLAALLLLFAPAIYFNYENDNLFLDEKNSKLLKMEKIY